MGTPNSSAHDVPAVDFYPYDLFMSDDPDEGRQAQKTSQIIFGIMAELRPILKYISVPLPVLHGYCFDGCAYKGGRHGNVGDLYTSRIRGVKLLEVRAHRQNREEFLFLQENGDFFVSALCCDGTKPDHYHDLVKDDPGYTPITWSRMKFNELIATLKGVLEEAARKKEAHVAGIRQRSEMLDTMLVILHRKG